MSEYQRIVLVSRPAEPQPEFAARLSVFWTHMLRTRPEDFEKVYAESTEFEQVGARVSRQYLVEPEAVEALQAEFVRAGLDYQPIDLDDTFSKYEAVPADWWQIEH